MNQRKRPVNDENSDLIVPLNDGDSSSNPIKKGVLPLTRVKRIIKMSTLADSVNVSAGAAKLIQLVAEEYLRSFVRTSQIYAEQSGRKTIQPKDLNRVIKDDWAFALLEDAISDWPNDKDQPSIKLSKLKITETDSSSLFHRNLNEEEQVQSDSVMTDRYIPDDDFDNSEFNETDIGLEYTHNGIPTPKPTMEYLERAPITDSMQCNIADTLTFEDDENDGIDEEMPRPHNSKFLNSDPFEDESDSPNSRQIVEESDEYDEILDNDSATVTPSPNSPIEFDLNDIEDM